MATAETTTSASVPEGVLDWVMRRIVDGTFPVGQRLPAERDLVDDTGTSRVSVREALRRLADWGVLSIRRGSGAVVRPRREWCFEALPDALQQLARAGDLPTAAGLVVDALALRRTVVLDVAARSASHLHPGALDAARAAMRQAWEHRDNPREFARLDLEISRRVLEAAGLLASLWMVNSLGRIYLPLIDALPVRPRIPDDYVQAHTRFFDAMESGDGEAARRIGHDYLTRHDEAMLVSLRRLVPGVTR